MQMPEKWAEVAVAIRIMKKHILTGLALLAIFRLSAQEISTDSISYKSRKLSIDEINLVSSYYVQDGERSAVTGGIGTEHLTDISNTLDVKLIRHNKSGKKQTFDLEAGIDLYSSASSDRIDLMANSSASSQDVRFYPSAHYTVENEEKGNSLGFGLSSSTEYDYQSFGASAAYSKKTRDKNGEFTARVQAFIDQVKMIAPVELRDVADNSGTEPRNTYAASVSYSQVINRNFQVMFLADVIAQSGYLSLPFHRVYLQDGTVRQEKLPDSRFKIPVGIRASYFVGDNFIVRTYYRFYTDDWGVKSHTANLEIPVKLSSFFSVSPFYRYYTQTAVKYFRGYGEHAPDAEFYTSNFDLSRFDSHFMGLGLRVQPVKGILGMKNFNMMEIRYGHYSKSTNMVADVVSVNFRYR